MAREARLAIFDTFKSGTGPTGEAGRQRSIIAMLAGRASPSERTRTGIAKRMAKEHDAPWKNIYSGIFHDIEKVLLPLEMVEEGGRLPLKRGPKALQEKGIPYYRLTRRGMLAALAIPETENKAGVLAGFFEGADAGEREHEVVLGDLLTACPGFGYLVFDEYVRAFCDGRTDDLLPFDLARAGGMRDESVRGQVEALEGLLSLPKPKRDGAVKFLKTMV